MSNLQPKQFPIYEVGDPDNDAPERGYRSQQYSGEHEVSPETFGFPVEPATETGSHPRYTKGVRIEPREEDLPLDKIRYAQEYVYEPHARNLSTIPAEQFHDTQQYDPVEASETPEGYWLTHGAHRTAAARLRGDQTVRAKVSGRWSE